MAARFPDRQRASAALDALRQRLHLSVGAAAIAPLGTPGRHPAGDETLLAGHFKDDQSGVVRSLVSRAGGEVVADVDELWTRPRVQLNQAVTTERQRTPRRTQNLVAAQAAGRR